MKRMLAFKRILLLILGSMIFLVGQDVFAGSGKDEPIPAGSCPATLYIGALDSGETYQLVLTNQFGDRLEGIINQ